MKGIFSLKVFKSLSLFAMGVLTGAVLGVLGTFAYSGKELSQYIALQQEMELEESGQLAWKAYSSEPPKTAIWALSNYIDKIEKIYSLRPAKDRQYYYLTFKGHARLMRLCQEIHDDNSAAAHLLPAVKAMSGWSNETSTNSQQVLDLIERLDKDEKRLTASFDRSLK